jgi:hypothetical protein
MPRLKIERHVKAVWINNKSAKCYRAGVEYELLEDVDDHRAGDLFIGYVREWRDQQMMQLVIPVRFLRSKR